MPCAKRKGKAANTGIHAYINTQLSYLSPHRSTAAALSFSFCLALTSLGKYVFMKFMRAGSRFAATALAIC